MVEELSTSANALVPIKTLQFQQRQSTYLQERKDEVELADLILEAVRNVDADFSWGECSLGWNTLLRKTGILSHAEFDRFHKMEEPLFEALRNTYAQDFTIEQYGVKKYTLEESLKEVAGVGSYLGGAVGGFFGAMFTLIAPVPGICALGAAATLYVLGSRSMPRLEEKRYERRRIDFLNAYASQSIDTHLSVEKVKGLYRFIGEFSEVFDTIDHRLASTSVFQSTAPLSKKEKKQIQTYLTQGYSQYKRFVSGVEEVLEEHSAKFCEFHNE